MNNDIRKPDNLDKMDKFLETHLSKLNQEASENLNRQITPSETEAVIEKLPRNKSLGPDDITGGFYQIFQKVKPLLLNYFIKFKRT